jgi:hypothetical protein
MEQGSGRLARPLPRVVEGSRPANVVRRLCRSELPPSDALGARETRSFT